MALAHVAGLNVLPPIIVIPGVDAGGAALIEEHRDEYRREIVALKAVFEETTRGEPFVAEWIEVDAGYEHGATKLVELARSADLVVVSTRDPEWGYSAHLEAPDRVVLECAPARSVDPPSARKRPPSPDCAASGNALKRR